MGLVMNHLVIRRLELSVPASTSHLRGGKKGWRLPVVSDLINLAYIMNPPQKPKRLEFQKLLSW